MTRVICAVLAVATLCAGLAAARRSHQEDAQSHSAPLRPLRNPAPANGVTNVAFLVSQNTTLIDLAGPLDVFVSTMLTPQGQPWRGGGDMVMPFDPYTVSDSEKPIFAEGLENSAG